MPTRCEMTPEWRSGRSFSMSSMRFFTPRVFRSMARWLSFAAWSSMVSFLRFFWLDGIGVVERSVGARMLAGAQLSQNGNR
eukprot:11568529-Heterocapsa_arctica.AAC.1